MVAQSGRASTRELLVAELERLSEPALVSLLEIARAVKEASGPAGAPGSIFTDVVDELGQIPDDDAGLMRDAVRQCRQVKTDDW